MKAHIRHGAGGTRVVETCGGKVRHVSRREAITSANHLTKGRSERRHGRPRELHAYHCPRCNGWHLTKQEQDQ